MFAPPCLLHSPCRCRVDLEGAASRWASSQRSSSCCQSSEFIGRYRRPTAGAMALAESSRVRSGSAARATAVRAWCPRVPEERLERAESRLRGWDRRTADQRSSSTMSHRPAPAVGTPAEHVGGCKLTRLRKVNNPVYGPSVQQASPACLSAGRTGWHALEGSGQGHRVPTEIKRDTTRMHAATACGHTRAVQIVSLHQCLLYESHRTQQVGSRALSTMRSLLCAR